MYAREGEFADPCDIQYSDETADLLARQLLDGATPETSIAVVSAPSVFVALKNILVSIGPPFVWDKHIHPILLWHVR